MEPAPLDAKIEAILFSEGEAIPKSRLSKWLNTSAESVEEALHALRARLTGGLTLVTTDTTALLVIAGSVSETVQKIFEADNAKEIGEAGLEVLSILLYKGPSTRSQIEFIRGVNSSTTVRALILRGLIERAGNPTDGREFIYRPTAQLLAHLGITNTEMLPDYDILRNELESFAKTNPFGHSDPYATTTDSTDTAASV